MIEFKKRKSTKAASKRSDEVVFIGQTIDEYDFLDQGRVIENVRVRSWTGLKGEQIDIIAENREIGEKILSKIKDVETTPAENIRIIIKNWDTNSRPAIDKLYVQFEDIRRSDEIDATFYLNYNLRFWDYSFDFDEYFVEFSRIDGLRIFAKNVVQENEKTVGIELGCSLPQVSNSLLTNILERQNIIASFHNEAINRLTKAKTFLATFDFPNEIKINCEQYLLYFAQFLQDLGINADSNLKEEAGKVLFSVTPTDGAEALSKIREALALYLHLPNSPIVFDDSFASMRAQQQIENLQHSQRMAVRERQFNEKLLIAQSDTIREKNITISQQETVIERQNKIIEKISSKSIMMDSVENKEELEEIYDGLKIGESKFLKEQFGIHLNPAKVIKTAVKNTFGKESEKNSVLELKEETNQENN